MDTIVQLNFYDYLNDVNYINLLSTKSEYYKLLDDKIYKILLYNKFSENFINRAKHIIISWKGCYLRIKMFENNMLKYTNNNLWVEDNYFEFWKFKYRTIKQNELYSSYYRNYYNYYN